VRSIIRNRAPRRLAALVLVAALAPVAAAQPVDLGALTLEEAIARALEKNERILIERLSLDSAEAAITGAEGAYDPVLGLDAGWFRSTTPVSSSFSGAPEGELAPTLEGFEVGAGVRQLLPTGGQVLLSADGSRTETDASFDLLSPSYGSGLGVELRQPLLRDRGIDAARLRLRVAAADRDRAAASLRREVIETVAGVERAYWTLLAFRRAVEVREEAVALAEEQLSETEIRIENGASPETEVAQPRAELERRRGDLLETREVVARAESNLKLLILSDADTDLWLAPVVPVEPVEVAPVEVDLAAEMARALGLRAELDAAGAVIEQRRAETGFARDRVKPALDLVVSYDRFGLAGSRNPRNEPIPGFPVGVPGGLEGNFGDSLERIVDGDFDEARIGFAFELPIGNRAAKAAAVIAENAERQSEADLAVLRKVVRAEVLDAAAALEAADGRIEAARAAREAAEVQLDAERERYAVGLSTNFLVLTRQNDLAGARLDEIEAVTDHLNARTELGRATGSLLQLRGIEMDTRPEAPPEAPQEAQ
jgi:HAE1 family hydrophobic/amphiphilic exporter-1